jgi:hypothetical protein
MDEQTNEWVELHGQLQLAPYLMGRRSVQAELALKRPGDRRRQYRVPRRSAHMATDSGATGSLTKVKGTGAGLAASRAGRAGRVCFNPAFCYRMTPRNVRPSVGPGPSSQHQSRRAGPKGTLPATIEPHKLCMALRLGHEVVCCLATN